MSQTVVRSRASIGLHERTCDDARSRPALPAGVGNYLLISLVTRYVQTPVEVGYGFGATVVVAGLVLVPLSLGSVAASRVAPLLVRRASPEAVLPVGSLLFVAALGTFAVALHPCGAAWLVVRGVPASERRGPREQRRLHMPYDER